MNMAHDLPIAHADLFDLTQTAHAELFSEIEYGWEVLPLLKEYLQYKAEDAQILGTVEEGAFVDKGVAIGKGTTVEAGAVIKGPAIIGENCEIRTSAYIRGGVIVGDNCIVGNSTEVKNSLLFNGVAIAHFNYVGDSVLGQNVHLGAGVILSNLKTPPSEIVIHTLEQEYPTGLDKLGAIIGDNVEIGVNAVLNPGTIIGPGTMIYPLASVRGVIPSNVILKVRQEQEVTIKRVLRDDVV